MKASKAPQKAPKNCTMMYANPSGQLNLPLSLRNMNTRVTAGLKWDPEMLEHRARIHQYAKRKITPLVILWKTVRTTVPQNSKIRIKKLDQNTLAKELPSFFIFIK